jgi:Domain of unknown function (DUF4377)
MKSFMCILLIISQVGACTDVSNSQTAADAKTETWQIKHHKTIAQGESAQWCYLVRKSETGDWQFFYAPIAKFNYQWGHDYVVKVKQTKVANPPAGGSSLQFEVVSVVSDKTVSAGTTFEIPLTTETLDSKNHKVLQTIEYVTDSKIAEKTRQTIAAGHLTKGIFQHGEGGKLILKDVQ